MYKSEIKTVFCISFLNRFWRGLRLKMFWPGSDFLPVFFHFFYIFILVLLTSLNLGGISMDKITFFNEIEATGKVVAINDDSQWCSVRMVTKNGKIDTYPLFQCKKKMLAGLKLKDRIKIKGHVSVFYLDRNGSTQRRQCFVADSISKLTTMCEEKFGVKGKFYQDPSVELCLSGKFKSQDIRDDGWMSMNLQISDNPKDVVRINMKKLDRQPQIKKDEMVYVNCGVSTVNKQFGDKKMHYENIIVRDIAVS